MAKHSTCAISKRELEEKYLTQEKCSPNRSGSRTSERPREEEEEEEGEGGRETNKSTIGIYACISDERAGGSRSEEGGLKRDEWLKSSRHNDPAICSASVHNDDDHIQ